MPMLVFSRITQMTGIIIGQSQCINSLDYRSSPHNILVARGEKIDEEIWGELVVEEYVDEYGEVARRYALGGGVCMGTDLICWFLPVLRRVHKELSRGSWMLKRGRFFFTCIVREFSFIVHPQPQS